MILQYNERTPKVCFDGSFLQEIESLRGDKAGIEARVSRTLQTGQDHFFVLLSNVKRRQQKFSRFK